MSGLESIEQKIIDLELQLRPIAQKPISFEDIDGSILSADEERKLKEINDSAQEFLLTLINKYLEGPENIRRIIRCYFEKNDSFSWGIKYKISNNSEREYKRYFTYMSMLDQGRDTRDFLLEIDYVVGEAKKKKYPYKEVLLEIANISSDQDKYGMGSTKQILKSFT